MHPAKEDADYCTVGTLADEVVRLMEASDHYRRHLLVEQEEQVAFGRPYLHPLVEVEEQVACDYPYRYLVGELEGHVDVFFVSIGRGGSSIWDPSGA